ncbi:DUF2066 domain-containing protein [Stutzerimonas urumqiensis]|uniref:DUF2066 domain-containing protein n=1 Tax=Stutzerimonas urumqiensis TaxID=638269 RepID=UPI000EB3E4E5|nr:DUF2066 domain-containing protein [Stutzerimonas urumqiensis]
MRPIVRLLMLCCLVLAQPVAAEPLEDLYLVRQPIDSQQPADREAALQRALDTLIIRLTGDPQVVESSNLAAVRAEPKQLVRQFGYEGDVLVANFDATSVQRALRDAGIATWGENRPSLLVWWLAESAEGTSLIGDGQGGADMLRSAAQHRGLPVQIPLADLQEQLAVTRDAIERAEPSAFAESSERYDADALLTVLAREEGEGWQARWHVWLGDQHGEGQATGTSQEALADAVMLAVQRYLAPRFVGVEGELSSVTLKVEGANLARFAELDELLQPLGAQLHQVSGDELIYRLEARPEQLQAQLELIGLQPLPDEVPEPSPLVTQPGGAAIGAPIEAAIEAPTEAPATEGLVLRYGW